MGTRQRKQPRKLTTKCGRTRSRRLGPTARGKTQNAQEREQCRARAVRALLDPALSTHRSRSPWTAVLGAAAPAQALHLCTLLLPPFCTDNDLPATSLTCRTLHASSHPPGPLSGFSAFLAHSDSLHICTPMLLRVPFLHQQRTPFTLAFFFLT